MNLDSQHVSNLHLKSDDPEHETPLKTLYENDPPGPLQNPTDVHSKTEQEKTALTNSCSCVDCMSLRSDNQPAEHDDRIGILESQVLRQQEDIEKLKRENEEFKSLLKLKSKNSPLTGETKYLTKQVGELKNDLDEAKKREFCLKISKQYIKKELKATEKKLANTQDENTSLTLELQNTTYANTQCYNLLHTVRAQLCAREEELLEAQSALSDLQQQMRGQAIASVKLQEHTQDCSLQSVRATGFSTRVGDKRFHFSCPQCLQHCRTRHEQCHFHPIPPRTYDEWRDLPELRDYAADPWYRDYVRNYRRKDLKNV